MGDNVYEPLPPFGGAVADHEALRLFQFTLAQEAIDTAADMFPVYRYEPVIRDSGPLMEPPVPALGGESGLNQGLLVVSGLLLALSLVTLHAVFDLDVAAAFRRAVQPAFHRPGRVGER